MLDDENILQKSREGRCVNIIISNSSDKPIYEQIASQIKSLILTGALQTGEALPSLRLLAKELRVSVISTKRAYEELEREGFIESVAGKGSFVAGKNMQLIHEEYLRITEGYLQQAVDMARLSGLSESELVEMLVTIYRED
jgi:GntR family transcriptional regulator